MIRSHNSFRPEQKQQYKHEAVTTMKIKILELIQRCCQTKFHCIPYLSIAELNSRVSVGRVFDSKFCCFLLTIARRPKRKSEVGTQVDRNILSSFTMQGIDVEIEQIE